MAHADDGPAPRRPWWYALAALAALVYPPLLLTAPGRVVADTKTYLYLDPGRLLDRATSMWDPHIGMGTVPHQQIGYLWPMGPFFWVAEQIGLPDWVAQRLWIGTIMVAAGAGVLYLARTWRWRLAPAVAAAFVYALTPFVLTLAARISAILLPFAGLPWLLALTIRAVRRGGWRHPALFALTIATVGSVNATALLLIGIVPVLWIVYATLGSRERTVVRVLPAVTKIGGLTVAVNAWWIAGLSVQATNGIDILRYTETAEVVARASTAHEVLRGLGYWFFYGGDRLGQWIEPGVAYTQQLWLLSLTYGLAALGLLAAGIVRWRHRAFVVGLLAVGLLVSVGAHPWSSPSPFGRLVRAFLLTDVGLAMRSLPRAVPLVVLALAIAIGTLVGAMEAQDRRRGPVGAFAVALAAFLALPPLWTLGFVPENLDRPEEIPDYWEQAAAILDSRDDGTRVLEIPGTDFASYRWGNTVDPITPGLIDRPYVARELIPYGSAPSADLLNALDLKLQEQTLDPTGLAPVARFMGVGDIVARNDLQYERYNTPRPRTLAETLARAPGLGAPVAFGPTTANAPVADAPLVDEQHLASDRALPDPAAVVVHPVLSPQPIVRAARTDRTVLLSGDGTGVVDAAMAGLLHGDELLRYSSTVTGDPDFVIDVLRGERALIVTDTNRRRGERWTTVRHTQGYTELADGGILRDDLTDNRLPGQPEVEGGRSVAVHDPIEVRATGYGNPISFTPEERPVLAIDGDPSTAWRVAAFEDAVGHRIELTFPEEVTTGSIRLLQPQTGSVNRWITEVTLRFDGGRPERVALDETSRRAPGQIVTFDRRSFDDLSITIEADTAGRPPGFGGLTSVGFAEIGVDGLTTTEYVALPTDLLDTGGRRTDRYPLAFVLTRQRSAPTDVTRNDEELAIRRIFELPSERGFAVYGTARLSARASDVALDRLLGRSPEGGPEASASSRLPGGLRHRASNAFDGDPATAWTSAFAPSGQSVELRSPSPLPISRIAVDAVTDIDHSIIRQVEVHADGVPVGRIDLDNGSGVLGLVDPLVVSTLRLEVTEIDERTTIEWSSGDPIVLPVAIADIDLGTPVFGPLASSLDNGCRNDLVAVDGLPVAVRISGSTATALAGEALRVTGCPGEVRLDGSEHRLTTAAGRTTGVDVDQLVLRSDGATQADHRTTPLVPPGVGGGPTVLVDRHDDTALTVTVDGAEPGTPFWLVLGESFNDGWRADADGDTEVDGPALVDGYANGWLVTPDTDTTSVRLRFAPQDRVDVAFRISAIGTVTCIGLALLRPRRAGARPHPDIEPLRRLRATTWDGVLPTRRHALWVGVGAFAAGTVLATPVVGLVLGVLAGLATRREGWRPLFTVLPAFVLAGVGLYVIGVQFRNEIGPGLHWPADTGRFHPLAIAAVLALVIDVVIDRIWHRYPDNY